MQAGTTFAVWIVTDGQRDSRHLSNHEAVAVVTTRNKLRNGSPQARVEQWEARLERLVEVEEPLTQRRAPLAGRG